MDITLTVATGRPQGSRASRRLRAEGKIPGVVYGLGREPKSVVVEWAELRRALATDAGLNALIDLDVDGETNLSVVKELQRDPVRRTVDHVDFLLIDRDAPLSVDVPITLVGTAPKVDAQKGMIDQLLYTLTVNARPGFIPTQLDADVSDLEIGTQLKAGDIQLPDGVTTDVDPDLAVAQGSPTRSTIILQQQAAREERRARGEDVDDEEPIDESY
ncbi:MAG: 50S ribosomal protein L25 [Acidimicrobiales bacterium]|jgi:large subunit ribosomal protein L25|nr:50S ribosomal protein L25 [Acidimicrobiales bacterium]